MWEPRKARRRPRGSKTRHAEVEDLGVAALGEENVGGLDVAMDDTGRVRGVERVRNLDGRSEALDRPGAARARDARASVSPLEIFHHEEVSAVLLPDVVQGADVG